MRVATTKELNYIRNLLTNDETDLAISELRKLHNRYPNDSVVLYELGTTLLRQGTNINEALFILNLATNSTNKDAIINDIGIYYLNHGEFDKAKEKFLQLIKGNELSRCYGYSGLIRTYIHTEEFDEALTCFDILNKVRGYIDYSFQVSHYYNLKFYLLYKNGLLTENSHVDTYFRRQVINYDKDLAIEHIKEHLKEKEEINNDPEREKLIHSVFNKDVDIEEIYDYCRHYIQDKTPDNYGFIDYYRCELNESIGITYNSKEATSIEIVTVPNTKDILSIYPVNNKHINKISEERTKERKQPKKKKYKNNKKNY